MNTRNILMLAGGAIAGYLIYDKFIKKNGGTESFSGRRIKRPTTQKANQGACGFTEVGCPSTFKWGTGGCAKCASCGLAGGQVTYNNDRLYCNGEFMGGSFNNMGLPTRTRVRKETIKR
jgi:hypothetical protein